MAGRIRRRRARKTLQVYVVRLRHADRFVEAIVERGGGYVLNPDVVLPVDATRAPTLVGEGTWKTMRVGDPNQRPVCWLRRPEAFHGEPYEGGFADTALPAGEVARLEELTGDGPWKRHEW